ncbi:hypothetical protein SODALDRAFT_327284 [Sodiomyces alkalinus F11]|uniref:Inner membrane assembly complex subunit 17 n=1 Tax=Sodiomyces alkalinus (strain CBS 110278 / VKM F-3762 / F11) TaxID=1314773 RepID=A0A3N2Q921_SODAK|nr:hypothetical protein SODALDRAFT_327284 [Sodiomyces alkalinus F11]ROT43115.1 hypothetical protein SODALDRAFT_327284 [Sodiomyces alkalinus F11]
MSALRRAILLPRVLGLRSEFGTRATWQTQAKRCYATEGKPPSDVAKFYKTFTRPVLKVLLMATLTYQVVYLLWVKLEQDEIRAERTETITDLETKVARLTSEPNKSQNHTEAGKRRE